jgi:hypothetical protein
MWRGQESCSSTKDERVNKARRKPINDKEMDLAGLVASLLRTGGRRLAFRLLVMALSGHPQVRRDPLCHKTGTLKPFLQQDQEIECLPPSFHHAIITGANPVRIFPYRVVEKEQRELTCKPKVRA